jgi:hypothetical protein
LVHQKFANPMRLYLPGLLLIGLCACHSAPRDIYSLDDTVNYKLTNTQEGGGGVFAKMETYTHREDTSRTYVKVYSYAKKLAAVQFYKGPKKDGPTITYGDNGAPQLGTYYRNDTVVDMHPFK